MQREARFYLMIGMLAACCCSCGHNAPTEPPIQRWPVRGTVEDRMGGTPIEGAELKFFGDKDSANTISDNRGWFEVELLKGDYFFVASKTGYLARRDTIEVADPGLEFQVQLVVDPAQDYLPLAVGNWWEYDDNSYEFYSGMSFSRWGTRRWEIMSASLVSNDIIYGVRVTASGKQTRYPPLPPPYDTTFYADTDSFDIVESDGCVTLGDCTTLKHFMQPGDKFAPRGMSCDSSRVSTGAPIIVNGLQLETLKIDVIGLVVNEETSVAQQIGIVLRDFRSGVGNTRHAEHLRLQRYFVQNFQAPK
jgi:hypothetical protein